MSSIVVAGDTSGTITIAAPAVAGSGTLTLPVATDTLVGKATTDTLTNKTLTSPVINGFTGNTSVINIGSGQIYKDASGNVGIGTASPVASLQVSKLTTVLSGTGNAFGVYVYPTSSGACYIDALTTLASVTDLSLRTYNNGTYNAFIGTTGGGTATTFKVGATERMRIDSSGNTYVETGNLWEYSPAPTALAAGANAGTAAQLRSGMFSAAQTTAVTLTMPTGTAIDTGFAAPAVDIGFDFYVINTGSALGDVTVAVNTNVTSLGSLVVTIGTSAQFRLRRTVANTYVMCRLS